MAWIESHQTLREHPKTKKLCRVLGCSKPEALGHLHMLWWWAMDYAQDGDLSRYDALDIAIGAEWEGDESTFVAALITSGFLSQTDGLHIHDWHDYAGKLIERKAKNAARMREARAGTDDDTCIARAMHVSKSVKLPNQTVPNQTKPTEPGDTPPSPPEMPKNIEQHARTIKTAVPDDLLDQIPAETRFLIGAEQGMDPETMRRETENLIDHFRGKGERRADWVATWRKWMRSDFRKPRGSPPTAINGRNGSHPSALDFAAKAIELERQGL